MTEYTPKPPSTKRRHFATPRALRRYLGFTSLATRPDAEAQPIERVLIEPEARQLITSLLVPGGHYRSGALFGTRSDGIAHVTEATHAGYPAFRPDRRRNPLTIDEQYLLGWSDCLTHYGRNDVDWIGHWLVRPDNLIGDSLHHYAWLQRAQRQGLVSDDHFFMFVGIGAETVNFVAYTYFDGIATELPVTLS